MTVWLDLGGWHRQVTLARGFPSIESYSGPDSELITALTEQQNRATLLQLFGKLFS